MATVRIVKDEFGLTKQPVTNEVETVSRFTFSNSNGVSVQVLVTDLFNCVRNYIKLLSFKKVITYGATITSIMSPDKNGHIDDIALGYDNMEGFPIK